MYHGHSDPHTKAGNTSTRLSNLEDYKELDCTFTDGLP